MYADRWMLYIYIYITSNTEVYSKDVEIGEFFFLPKQKPMFSFVEVLLKFLLWYNLQIHQYIYIYIYIYI